MINESMLDYQIRFTYIDGKQIQYKLIYQPVHQPHIYLKRNEIFVVTSKKMEKYAIDEFVPMNINKYVFVSNKKEEHASINNDLTKFKIFEKYYEIKQANLKGNIKYEIIGNSIYLNNKYKKEIIIRDVYTNIICPYVIKRVRYWQITMGLTKYKIDIHFNWNRRVLGTCHAPNDNKVKINFTNRIFSYGKKQMDCIIVHELSHIVHFHHKKNFWDHVKKYLPDYYKYHKEIIWT